MTLFFNPTGPFVRYDGGLLKIDDLNPEVHTQWTMSRGEMLGLAWRCFLSAIRPS